MSGRTIRLGIGSAALALVLAAASCARPPAPPPPPPPMPAAAAPAPAAQLTDAQIAQIAYSAGQIDIRAAKLALRKSHNRRVRAFAHEMVRDHSAVNRKALALLKRLNVTPEPSAISRSITEQADAEYAKLGALRGPAFNRAYAENEVAYHQEVNSALADKLIPSTQNPQLKGLLETGLKIFQEHERHAEQLAASLR